ncbi:hypothetical protein GCM10010439_05590 [Actinocorallia aurantiaca]|uniref:Uncharacterized protein n=1 Tax=Actinocorallia aurantiaca TaxID=46204 RepID=A0ABN3TWY7_9ACTN
MPRTYFFEVCLRPFQGRGGACSAQQRFGGHLGALAPQHAVSAESVHGFARRVTGLFHTGQQRDLKQSVIHGHEGTQGSDVSRITYHL